MKKFLPIPIIFLFFLFSPIVFAHYEHFKIPTATITIDGNMDDWNDIEPAYIDEVNDQDPSADYDGTDLHKLYLAKDDTFLYLMMTLYDGSPREEEVSSWTTYYAVKFCQLPSGDSVGDYYTGVAFESGTWGAGVSEITSVDPWEYRNVINYPSRYVRTGGKFMEWKVYLTDIGTLNGRFIGFWIHTHDTEEPDKYPLNDSDYTFIHIINENTATTTPTPTATATPTSSPTPKATPTPTPATGTGIIYGTVTDDEGFPFKNVSVSMTGANSYSKSTKTDKEGYYEFTDLAAGDYTLTYEKDGYQAKTQEVSLEEGETLELEIIVMEQAEKGSISGYVTTIYGDPIESVKLKLKGIRTKAIKIESTDADGFFEFADLEADDYMITATKKRYRSARKTVTIEEGEAKEIEIEMRKTTKRKSLSLLMRGK